MLYWGNGKEKHFLRHLNLKIIVLPRQARDKHRENSKKSDGVSHRRPQRTRMQRRWFGR
jgi:hypothetical protein